jgi:hypothetical protein
MKRWSLLTAVMLLAAVCGACGGGGGGGGGGEGDAGAGEWSADEECPAEAPMCDASTGECVGCRGITAEECARFDAAPYCIEGQCVGCGEARVSEWCAAHSSGLVCESETGRCRGCEANAECDSGACAGSECVAEEQAIYVAPGGSLTSDCSRAEPCRTIARGFEVAEPTRGTVVLADGLYEEAILLSDTSGRWVASVVGDGAILHRPTAGPIIRVRDQRVAWFERVFVEGATGTGGNGVYCTGSSPGGYVTMGSSVIRDNAANGILATGCRVFLYGTTIANNGANGIRADMVTLESVELEESVVEDNQGVGVLVSRTAIGSVWNSFVRRNAGGGVDFDVANMVSPGPFPSGPGNFAGEPAFVDPDSGDYDIGAESDAIDRGDPEEGLRVDIHGDARGRLEMSDLGADEYTP